MKRQLHCKLDGAFVAADAKITNSDTNSRLLNLRHFEYTNSSWKKHELVYFFLMTHAGRFEIKHINRYSSPGEM